MHRDAKLLKLARGQSCVSCGIEDGTVVWAHANGYEWGKGMGIKSHDCMGMMLCAECHARLDQGSLWNREQKREFTYRMICKTHIRLWEQGMVKVA